ncbi:CoA-transferase [Piscinibacter sakaiensis]|uniref:CoA-transferase n=1 Tax=Piscinibacter sakaiensis TaxID=1547922 RepID=UPI003AB0C72B
MTTADGKLANLADAAELARGSARVALGGWSFSRRPMAAAMHWAAHGLRFDELLVLTGGIETDLLVATGVVQRVRGFYLGMEALGMGPGLKIGCEVVEETETSLMLGLNAVVEGASFLPLPARHGVALAQLRPDLRSLRCPYTDEEQLAIPPLHIDVAYVHAWRADRQGNAVFAGHRAADRLLALAARQTVVTCEELVDDINADGVEADLTEPLVCMVVHAPGGAKPGGCLPSYEADWPTLLDYCALERDAVAGWARARLEGLAR